MLVMHTTVITIYNALTIVQLPTILMHLLFYIQLLQMRSLMIRCSIKNFPYLVENLCILDVAQGDQEKNAL